MKTRIEDIQKKYFKKIEPLEVELLIAHTIRKTREFVLAYPEFELKKNQREKIENYLQRRLRFEPLAYILGHKEFYGLDFKVTPATLIPRPETEMLVEEARFFLKKKIKNNASSHPIIVADIGTGSGNIILSLARNIKSKNIKFFGTDISHEALRVAKYNSKKLKLEKRVSFVSGDLLRPLIKKINWKDKNYAILILANLPYLSGKIYSDTPRDVKNYEPKSALYSGKNGLAHYENLFKQIKELIEKHSISSASCYAEFSPEQKILLENLIERKFPTILSEFSKDLSGKWRLLKIIC